MPRQMKVQCGVPSRSSWRIGCGYAACQTNCGMPFIRRASPLVCHIRRYSASMVSFIQSRRLLGRGRQASCQDGRIRQYHPICCFLAASTSDLDRLRQLGPIYVRTRQRLHQRRPGSLQRNNRTCFHDSAPSKLNLQTRVRTGEVSPRKRQPEGASRESSSRLLERSTCGVPILFRGQNPTHCLRTRGPTAHKEPKLQRSWQWKAIQEPVNTIGRTGRGSIYGG
jgi:hypothetical protein